MAHNLILGDPFEGKWCVYGQVGTIGDSPKHVLAFYKTQKDASEAAKSLREKFGGQISIRVFDYCYAKDEMDLMKLMVLDGIHMAIQYLVA